MSWEIVVRFCHLVPVRYCCKAMLWDTVTNLVVRYCCKAMLWDTVTNLVVRYCCKAMLWDTVTNRVVRYCCKVMLWDTVAASEAVTVATNILIMVIVYKGVPTMPKLLCAGISLLLGTNSSCLIWDSLWLPKDQFSTRAQSNLKRS